MSDPRFAFITIGQTPRTDLVPQMREWIGGSVHVDEFGALDGLSKEEIALHAPGDQDHRLVTRLRDGSEVVVAKSWMEGRVQGVLDAIPENVYLAAVLLCTGHFPNLEARGLFVESQLVVDKMTEALSLGANSIGVIVPHEKQAKEIHVPAKAGQKVVATHASPYELTRLEQTAGELSGVDIIVMHCIGYTDEMRKIVANVSGRPVLLARRLVATAIEQLI